MNLVDTNLLMHAFSGTSPVGLPWIVLRAFLRITTRVGMRHANPNPIAD